VEAHAGFSQSADKRLVQAIGPIPVDSDVDLRAALRRLDQRLAQRAAHLVVKQDKGLQQDLVLRAPYRLEHARKESLAVFQELDGIVVSPDAGHSRTSAARGAWSDRKSVV